MKEAYYKYICIWKKCGEGPVVWAQLTSPLMVQLFSHACHWYHILLYILGCALWVKGQCCITSMWHFMHYGGEDLYCRAATELNCRCTFIFKSYP